MSAREGVVDAAVYMQIADLVEVSAKGVAYSLKGLSLDTVEASLVRLAELGLVESMPDGKTWRVRVGQ